MAFTEDLDQFFDTSNTGPAVAGILKTAAGATLRTIPVIFTDKSDAIPMFDTPAESGLAFAQCKTADLAGVDNTHTLTIAGTKYRIVSHPNDGIGTTILRLEK